MKVSRIRAQLGLSKPTLSLRTHTAIHDFPNRPWHPPRPALFWGSSSFSPHCFSFSQTLLAWPCTASHTILFQTQHTLCSKLKYQGLLSNTLLMVSSTNGFIFAHINSAPTKRSCSPLFLRKLAENLLNPSLLLLLCCVSAGAPSKRASETGAIRTWAGSWRIRPFSTNKADYRKTQTHWHCSTVWYWRWFDGTESYQRVSRCLIFPVRAQFLGRFSGVNVKNSVSEDLKQSHFLFVLLLFVKIKCSDLKLEDTEDCFLEKSHIEIEEFRITMKVIMIAWYITSWAWMVKSENVKLMRTFNVYVEVYIDTIPINPKGSDICWHLNNHLS